MKIYNASGTEMLDIIVDDSSVRYRSIMNDDSLTLNFSTPGPVTIPRGAYCDFEGARYTLFYPENFKKHGTRNFEYTVTLHGYREALKLFKFKDLFAKPYRLKFPLTARPQDFLQLLVDNMNLHDSGWSAGDCIEADDKLISFNHEYCLDVLNRVAEEFSTEWEVVGKTIHLRKVERFKDDPLPLSYGMGNGFKVGVGRSNNGDKQTIGRLYVQGGERNINYSDYGSLSLLLPKSATLVHDGKTYRADPDGMFITRDGNTNTAEDSYDASSHYPKRVGTVSHVIEVDGEKHFYDIRDTSIPENLNYRDCRIPGDKATIVFQSGPLAGREFDIEQTEDDLTGYIHAERRFKIVPAELDGQIMPGNLFVPQVGDKYAIFNISMPSTYISDEATKTGASWDMFREAVKYFAEHENEKFVFTGELDGIWSKSKWLEIGGKIVPGGHVLFSDPQFQPEGVVIRITAIKDYVNKPHKPEITLSNAPISGSFSADLGKIEAEEVVREAERKDTIRFTKRQWRDTKEAMSMLKQSLLEFSSGISPITVQTMQLLVGDESLQFRFVNSKTNPQPVNHSVNYNAATGVLTALSGILQHMTLGITALKKTHGADEYRYWDMSAYTSPALEPDKPYYLYAKCEKAAPGGTFLLSEEAMSLDSDANYYHFLVGILNSEHDGDRTFIRLHGFTEITPGRITVDRIEGTDGKMLIDLLNGIIAGKIKFLSGTDEVDLESWADDTTNDINTAQDAAEAAQGAASAAQSTADSLKNFTDTTFADGLVDRSERVSIEKYLNSLHETKLSVDGGYTQVHGNTYLEGVAKTNLEAAKTALDTAYANLISSINTAIAGGTTTPAEKADVDAKFGLFNTALATYQVRLEEANKAIQDKLKSFSDEAKDVAGDAQDAVGDLSGYIDGAFKDGVIEEAEAKSIEKYLNSLAETKLTVDSAYTQVYNNSYLEGSAKTNLESAKTALNDAYTNLVNSINTAIAGGTTTPAEKADVDAKFGLFNTALATYQDRLEEANKSIQDKLKSFSDEAKAKAAQADYLRAALQQSTDIDGGVVLGSVIAGRDASGQVRSYQNGDPDLNNTAFAAGVHDFGTKDETRTVGLNHDGSADIGVLRVTQEGKVVLVDPETEDERLIFLEQDIPTAEHLQSGSTAGGSQSNAPGFSNDTFLLPNTLSVTENNSTITVTANELLVSATAGELGPPLSGGLPKPVSVSATLELHRNGGHYAELGRVNLLLYLEGESDSRSTQINRVITGCPSGDYSLRVRVNTSGNTTSRSASISASEMEWEGVKSVNWFQFGLNGFLAWFTNNAIHFDEMNGFFVKGKTEMPGVLLSATIGTSGGWSGVWGAKQSPTPPPAPSPTGRYTIYHTIGHTNYQVNCVSHTENRSFRVYAKNTNSVVVECRTIGSSPTLSNAMFDITLTGSNY